MTETFDAAWLQLREAIDHRSRSAELLPPLLDWWTAMGSSSVLDLGCGTGSNLRYMAPKLPRPQRWTLIDHDEALLAHIESPSRDVRVNPVRGDLAGAGLTEIGRADLVTASALLDLVSDSWLGAMVAACVDGRCGALFTLTYDGTIEWSADDPLDAFVRDAVNEHQRRDKGLGAALGPTAARRTEELFRGHGYQTWVAPSAWRLGADEAALTQALIAGWADAASDERPGRADAVGDWAERRRIAVIRGEVSVRVGHQDLLALPDADLAVP